MAKKMDLSSTFISHVILFQKDLGVTGRYSAHDTTNQPNNYKPYIEVEMETTALETFF